MHTALLERSLEGLDAIRRHVSFSAELRGQIGHVASLNNACEKCTRVSELLDQAPDPTNWRVIDHCIAVTRTYALFEIFVSQILREYLVFLASSYQLPELGEEFVIRYTKGIGQILVEQGKPRYENIDVNSLISDATAALSSSDGYLIQPEAMLRTEQNLRMTELQRLFSNCGLSGIEAWISRHRAVTSFFSSQSRLSDTAESELKQIVGYRNEAAHGDVDQVLGPEVLVEVTEFFRTLLQSITDFVGYDTLRRSKEVGKARTLGYITETFSNNVVVAKVLDSTIAVGDVLYIVGKGAILQSSVESIQLDDVDQTAVTVTEEREIGLRLAAPVKKGCELVKLV